jgi:chloramphenicol 3-O-phosphotransferase
VIGLARGLSAVVHGHVTYDLDLDTTRATPEELAKELVAFLAALPAALPAD